MSLLFDDENSTAARTWVGESSLPRLVSDFGWGEFVATAGRKVRAREPTDDQARAVLVAARSYFERWRWTAVEASDVRDATEMMGHFHLGLRLPDAIHLAIARQHGAAIITADHSQGDAAAALGIGYVDPTRPSKEPA